MSAKPYRIEVAHSADCFAVQAVLNGRWSTPWGPVPATPTVWADRWGRDDGQRGRQEWLRLCCNDPSCPAVVRVQVRAVAEIAERAALLVERRRKV